MIKLYQVEVCVGNIQSAIHSQDGGADRVELCDNLLEGGTTPSIGMIERVREILSIGLHVMIRPRGGDFFYSDDEYDVMRKDIEAVKRCRADAVAFGILRTDGSVDTERCKRLLDLARPMKATFHRAFDMANHPLQALDDLIELGFDYLLTSGQQNRAIEGIDLIKRLVYEAGKSIQVMAGSGVNERNVKRLIDSTDVRHVHVSCRKKVESPMEFMNENLRMSSSIESYSEYRLEVADPEKIRLIRAKLDSLR